MPEGNGNIDELRRQWADRKAGGRMSAADIALTGSHRGPRKGSMTQRLLAACAGFPAGEPIDREALYGRLGLDDLERKKATQIIYTLRAKGKFPYELKGAPAGRVPRPRPDPPAPGPAVAVAAMAPAPRPTPVPAPAPPAPSADVAALARVAAELGRLIDGYDAGQRAFASAYLRERVIEG